MAKGSHDTLGGWEPKLCAICEKPIVKARSHERGGLTFYFDDIEQVAYSFHNDCKRRRNEDQALAR